MAAKARTQPPPERSRQLVFMPLSDIRPAPRNPKEHDGPAIRGSIERWGLADLPVLDERTGRLVSGHGRLEQAQTMYAAGQDPPDGVEVDPSTGEWQLPVVRGWSSRSDPEAEAYLVMANQSTIMGGWDQRGLADVLSDLAAIDEELLNASGFNAGDLEDMLKLLEAPDLDALGEGLGDPDPSDTWPVVRIKAAPHVAAGWRSHLDTHVDENAALAALLELDPEQAPPSGWSP